MATRIRKGKLDIPLLGTTIGLTLFGLVAVWATSIPDAMFWYGSDAALHFVVSQTQWLLIGILVAAAVFVIGYRNLARLVPALAVAVLLLLIAVFFIGKSDYGSYRRLVIFGLSIQPSEIAKPVLILYLACWLSSKRDKLNDIDAALIPFLILVGSYLALILLQPNLSTAILLAMVSVTMLYLAGAATRQVLAVIAGGGALTVVIAMLIPYQRARILGLFGGRSSAAIQSQFVENLTRSAGMFGHGLDALQTQAQLVRGAHMDFVFAFATYGFGVFTALLLLAAFLFFGYRATRIAQHAQSEMGMLAAAGIGVWILLQALVHIGVNVGVLPITGLTLPFVSYGGTSLVACLMGTAILLSISSDTQRKETKTSAAYLYGGRNRRPRVSSVSRRPGAARRRARG
ncbi:MAG: FtsW/RodA/SpoVE family cell cycle protein [Anaerolineae bacterium]|jgi:cell division protein FtsW|nr:FtsW/RodA/SpoVE family cell cycle protein [Anaerolineae bacterium]